ncbi:YheC/YheD family protein [Brevibacillus sp. H7]|uniref:YheC/YheD family protein n=1 Tax=Brevibacillus sp. H7 TaxID=3349138 RepID=UPI003815BDED
MKEGSVKGRPSLFPFPDAIYMRCPVSKELAKKIEKVIGRKWFNTRIFHKWEAWQLLTKHKELCNHLPDTGKVKNENDIHVFFRRYQDVFLKPVDKYSSIGIVHATHQTKGKINIAYIRKLYQSYGKSFPSSKTLWKWIHSSLCKSDYIVQQGIRTIPWKGWATDIRLNMNKNGCGEWEITALFARFTDGGSYIGSGAGTGVLPLDFFLHASFRDNPEKVDTIRTSIINLGFAICRALENSGLHMADLSIDLGLDEDGHPWIFEVNPRPSPFSPPVTDESLARPIEYAYYLASNQKAANPVTQEKDTE